MVAHVKNVSKTENGDILNNKSAGSLLISVNRRRVMVENIVTVFVLVNYPVPRAQGVVPNHV
jgi:hypothetical protein